MASLRISPTPKRIVNLWFDYDDLVGHNSRVKYTFQGSNKSVNYSNIVFDTFTQYILKYCKVHFKFFNKHQVNHGSNVTNISPIVCMNMEDLQHSIENFDAAVYEYCHMRGIIVVFVMMRETIEGNEIADVIQKHIVDKGYDSRYIRILHTAYDCPRQLKQYRQYIVSVDSYSRILANITLRTNPEPSFLLPQDRSYNFSLLAGALRDRPAKCLFLAKSKNLNVLDSKFFYTMLLQNKDDDLKSIQHMFEGDLNYDIIADACSSLFEDRTYDERGELLTGSTIYQGLVEFKVPPQVLDSYIHIVLETNDVCSFISEKLYKPLMIGLPFVWHGCKNILAYLESQGFRRYEGIDYSFDSHPDRLVRLDMLIAEIQRLNTVELKELVAKNQPILDHNRQQFWKISENFNDLWGQLI